MQELARARSFLALIRCQRTFIFLHFPARVEALPGTRGFHYLRTTADTM